jgi:carbon monoxide dehydrogenase subunit G
MIFNKVCIVTVPINRLWDFMVDAQRVSACMPGVEGFTETAKETYQGTVKLSVGPISLRLNGTVSVVEREPSNWISRMSAQARDARIGGDVKATFTTRLVKTSDTETEIIIDTEAKVLGKLGEFGQPMMKKIADRYITQFVANIVQALGNQHQESVGQGERI